MTSHTDTIIIGAGAAGLSAAKTLRAAGVDFQIIEASHRIGGRAYSEDLAPGVPFDLGCSFMHHAEINPFVEIAREHGFRIDQDGLRGIFAKRGIFQNGAWESDERMAAYKAYMSDADNAIAAAQSAGRDSAVLDEIDIENEWSPFYISTLAAMNATDVDAVSVMDSMNWDWSENDWPIYKGFGSLVSTWGADVPVSLNTQVESIDWSGKDITVKTAKGDITCKKVLITVSTNILAAGDITFSPALPDWKRAAIDGLPTGTANKVAIHFDTDVFGDDTPRFCRVLTDGEPFMFMINSLGQNMAEAYVGGRHADWMERQGPDAMVAMTMDALAAAFGNDIRKHAGNTITTAWGTDPWTRGAYTCALPGQAHQRHVYARDIDERLYFAGEAAHTRCFAAAHGAYFTGHDAARAIAVSLGH